MDKAKRPKLEAAGWTVADPKALLGLTDEEVAFIEVKVALAGALKGQRLSRSLSQIEAAKQLHSSQSRVAKMEAADPSVSLDLLFRSILKLGGTRGALVAALAPQG